MICLVVFHFLLVSFAAFVAAFGCRLAGRNIRLPLDLCHIESASALERLYAHFGEESGFDVAGHERIGRVRDDESIEVDVALDDLAAEPRLDRQTRVCSFQSSAQSAQCNQPGTIAHWSQCAAQSASWVTCKSAPTSACAPLCAAHGSN